MQDKYFSDEELVAYLDGEADFSPTEEIAYALKHNADLVRRVEALRVDTGLIADSFAALKADSSSRPKLPEAPKIAGRYHQFAAAAMLALVVGFGIGFLTPKPDQSNWKTYVAAYQALYTNGTLVNVSQNELSKKQELTRVTAAIGKNIELSKLSSSPELEYKRAQILGFEGKALVQLAFLSRMGEPIALCIIRAGTNKRTEIHVNKMEGLSSASWSSGGYEFLLIGGTDQPLVSRIAAKFSLSNL